MLLFKFLYFLFTIASVDSEKVVGGGFFPLLFSLFTLFTGAVGGVGVVGPICGGGSFFNHDSFTCQQCTGAFVEEYSNDGCSCSPNTLIQDTCSIRELLEGCDDYPRCYSCQDDQKGVSLNQEQCVECSGEANFDIEVGACVCPENYRVIELYNPPRHECTPCKNGSIVILPSLGNEKESVYSAGKEFHPSRFECASCPDEMNFDDKGNCKCHEDHFLVGEESVGEQSCIHKDQVPSITSGYSRIQFDRIISYTGDGMTSLELDSLFASHLFMKSASRCEFSRKQSRKDIDSCSSLMNLCIMHSFEQTAAPCKLLQSIQRNRSDPMKQLVYTQRNEEIPYQEGVGFKMKFEEEGMEFRLARYRITGEFVGLEKLSNQLLPCLDENSLLETGIQIKFGRPSKVVAKCFMSDLMEYETFFWELFLVDTSRSCGQDGFDCLIPVPIQINEEKFVKRFTVLDTVSGRTSNQLEIIRVTSDTTLQFVLKEGSPSRIYVPVLRIEYVEYKVEDNNDNDITTTFRVAFSMITTKFWNYSKISFAFLAILALFLWAFFAYQYDARNRKQDSVSFEQNGSLPFSYAIALIAIGMRTIALTLLSFLVVTSSLWYGSYSIQSDLFLILPSSREEQQVFEYGLYSVFLMYTFSTSYSIYRQCNVKVLFLDWDSIKESGSSCWRKIMLVNEFNRISLYRKTKLEITLIIVSPFLLSHTRDNIVEVFAVSSFYFCLALVLQYSWNCLVIERFIREPVIQRYIDLSTLANISTIILTDQFNGYLLYTRSPTSLENLEDFSFRKNSLGLEGAPSGCQVFEVHLSQDFINTFNQLYEGNNLHDLEEFLQSFLKQTLDSSSKGFQYHVRQTSRVEKVLRTVPFEARGKHSSNVFIPIDEDSFGIDNSFTKSLLLGIELELIIHDYLTLVLACIIFRHSQLFALVFTYSVHCLRTTVTRYFSTRNLAKKSFFPEQFLSK